MLDLDALIGKKEIVKLGGKEYGVPIGKQSLTLPSMWHGKRASSALQKLAEGGEDLDESDINNIISFVSSASGIPVDVVRVQPFVVLSEIIALMFRDEIAKDPETEPGANEA